MVVRLKRLLDRRARWRGWFPPSPSVIGATVLSFSLSITIIATLINIRCDNDLDEGTRCQSVGDQFFRVPDAAGEK